MSKPKLIDAYTRESKLITSTSADYAEVGEWVDGNPDNEDRIGYFVSIDISTPGKTIVKSNSTSNVRGVTVSCPGFATNRELSMIDADEKLLPSFAYVAFSGFASVIDNGRCTINSKCVSDDDGTAIPSTQGYHVIDRIDSNHILILIENYASASSAHVVGKTLKF